MGLFDRLQPHFCYIPRRQLVKQLTSSDQEERRNTLAEVVNEFKLRVSNENHRSEARQLIKHLRHVRGDMDLAMSHKESKNHSLVLWISSLTPNTAEIVSTPEFRELNAVLNALEWVQQVTSTFKTLCGQCNAEVPATVGVPGSAATCPRCGTMVVRWLYCSQGDPVAYLLGEHVFKRSGAHIGNLEANQIWKSNYEGEILLDDRVMINYYWRGPYRQSYETAWPLIDPPQPPSKDPITPPTKGRADEYSDIRDRYL
jgi:hypothetical protein